MIRNAVIHIMNEQPLLADLFERPKPDDVGLLCTNLRMMDGRRPVFIDAIDGTFFFPYLHVRFVEIPRRALDLPEVEESDDPTAARNGTGRAAEGGDATDEDAELEIDEDFLRRVREA